MKLNLIKLSLLLVSLFVASFALAAQINARDFLPKLVGVKVLGQPMTEQEVLAMDPVCLEIGMGAAFEGSWGYPGMTREQLLATLSRSEYAEWTLLSPNVTAQWVHHYCWGKVSKTRFFSARDSAKGREYLKSWRDNMQYCIDWPSSRGIKWPFYPLMHKEIAESYFYEKAFQKAIVSANQAISMEPDLAAAYPVLADSYQAAGNQKKALEVVTEGLRQGAQTKGLKRRYKEWGGKMPFPEPLTKPQAEIKTEEKPFPVAEPVQPEPVSASPAKAENIEPPAVVLPATEQQIKPKNNPYCRFCP